MDPREHEPSESGEGDIAIIGMAGRFPGRATVEEFWQQPAPGRGVHLPLLSRGAGALPRAARRLDLRQHPQFVPAGGVLEDAEHFDPGFFDMSLREAQWMDPQQRLFLQCAWAALEDAGVRSGALPGRHLALRGRGDSGYLQVVLARRAADPAAFFEALGTDRRTRTWPPRRPTSWGSRARASWCTRRAPRAWWPSTWPARACCTRQSDVALAGAVALSLPQRTGYVYQEGMILSPDGHCRAFDASAQGTVPATAWAWWCSSAWPTRCAMATHLRRHPGLGHQQRRRHKSGFTAPSVQGQAAVIPQALAHRGRGRPRTSATWRPTAPARRWATRSRWPRSQRAFGLGAEHRGTMRHRLGEDQHRPPGRRRGHWRASSRPRWRCTTGRFPPASTSSSPTRHIDFDAGPFFVNTALATVEARRGPAARGGQLLRHRRHQRPRRARGGPRAAQRAEPPAPAARAAVGAHARGAGGAGASGSRRTWRPTRAAGRWRTWPSRTRWAARRFEHRRALVVQDADGAGAARCASLRRRVRAGRRGRGPAPRVAFLFPGQGAQQVAMGRELYAGRARSSARTLDACLALLEAPLRAEVRTLLLPGAGPGSRGHASC